MSSQGESHKPEPVARPCGFPPEIWLRIFELATDTPNLYCRDIRDPFDGRAGETGGAISFYRREERSTIRAALVTKRHLVRVCRQWCNLATPLLYRGLYIGRVRRLISLGNTLQESQTGGEGSIPLGSHVLRLDIAFGSPSEEGDLQITITDVEDHLCRIISCLSRLEILAVSASWRSISRGRPPVWMPTRVAACLGSTCGTSLRRLQWTRNSGLLFKPGDLHDLLRHIPNLRSVTGTEISYFPTNPIQLPNADYIGFLIQIASIPAPAPSPFPNIRHMLLKTAFLSSLIPSVTSLLGLTSHLKTVYLTSRGAEALLQSIRDAQIPHLVLHLNKWTSFRGRMRIPACVTHLGVAVDQLQAKDEDYGHFFDWLDMAAEHASALRFVRLLNPRGALDLAKHVNRLNRALAWLGERNIRLEDVRGLAIRPVSRRRLSPQLRS